MISRLMSPLNIGEKGAEAEHHFVVQLCRHLIFRPQFTRVSYRNTIHLICFNLVAVVDGYVFPLFLFLSLPFE